MYCELKTNRLLLRPLDITDLDAVHAYASDKENTMFMLWLPNDTKEETAQFLSKVTNEWKKDNPGYYEFAVTLDGKLIGAVSINLNAEKTMGELGWILHKRYWKKGYATEAAFAIKDFAVNTLRVSKLVAHCDYRNMASYRLMEKIGFCLEDDCANRTYFRSGETVKELTYSFIKSDM